MSEAAAEVQPQTIEERLSAALEPVSEEIPAEGQNDAETPDIEANEPSQEEQASGAEENQDAGDSESEDAEVPEVTEESEYLEIGTIAELAAHLDLDVADVYDNITVPIQTAEGRIEVPLGQWKDGWQANIKATNAEKALQEQRAQLEAERTQTMQQYQTQLTEAAGMVDGMVQAALAPYQSINWNQLHAEDPGMWAAKRQEMIEANSNAERMRYDVQQKIENFRRESEAQQMAQRAQLLEKEQAALYAAIPEIADPETAPAEMTAMRKYLQASGFTDDEISNAYDHRLVVMARKARLYDESQKSADAVKKKVLKLAKKTLKPGARQTKAEQQHDANRGLRAKLKKSGNVNDAAALIRATL